MIPLGKLEWHREGGFIQTYSGMQFYPLDPKPEDVLIVDIAHSLSQMCRYAGHSSEFYSVAEHCLRVSRLCPPDLALHGLLHDASEAYLLDIPTPIKQTSVFDEYRKAEARLERTIIQSFGMSVLTVEQEKLIKKADLQMLATEATQLLSPLHPDWKLPCPPVKGMRIACWDHKRAKAEFLEEFEVLYSRFKKEGT